MIDKNEMRIGNYFIGEDKILWLSQMRHAENVKEWFYKGWHEETKERIEVNFFDAEPIPLTTEILEKCGFIEVVTDHEWELKDNSFYVKRKFETEYFEHGYKSIELKYLHQLQNLYYALTQKELEINYNYYERRR